MIKFDQIDFLKTDNLVLLKLNYTARIILGIAGAFAAAFGMVGAFVLSIAGLAWVWSYFLGPEYAEPAVILALLSLIPLVLLYMWFKWLFNNSSPLPK